MGRELRQSEERTRLILETAAEGIVSFDVEAAIPTFNTAASQIFGVEGNDATGRSFMELLSPEDGDAMRFWIATRGNESDALARPREIEGRRSDGSTFPLRVAMSRSDSNDQISFTAVMRDLSEEKALESQLLQSKKLESIGQLAAGIAHEINTPAQFVSDNLEFMDDSLSDLEAVFAAIEELLGSSSGSSPELAALREASEKADLAFLGKELPGAVSQSRDGISRVAEIVRAMKDFSHPGPRASRTST